VKWYELTQAFNKMLGPLSSASTVFWIYTSTPRPTESDLPAKRAALQEVQEELYKFSSAGKDSTSAACSHAWFPSYCSFFRANAIV